MEDSREPSSHRYELTDAEITQRITSAIRSAPSVEQAQQVFHELDRTRGKLSTKTMLFAPGVCYFEDETTYSRALNILERMIPGIAPYEDTEHEIEHHNFATSRGFPAYLCVQLGFDNKKWTGPEVKWDGGWAKTFTFVVRPGGVSEDEWRKFLLGLFSAPTTLSTSDSAILEWLQDNH